MLSLSIMVSHLLYWVLLRLKYRQINDDSIGSLIARIVFQPIEETLRVFFSKILNSTSKEKDAEEKTRSTTQAENTLRSLLSIQASFSLIFVTFGSTYLPIFLTLLLPQQYMATSAPRILAAWVWYIPVLALNGGLEAFLSSVASPKDLNKQSRCVPTSILLSVGLVLNFETAG